ncbi:hypothetical protein GCM10028864_51550 [Microlunatus parietis]
MANGCHRLPWIVANRCPNPVPYPENHADKASPRTLGRRTHSPPAPVRPPRPAESGPADELVRSTEKVPIVQFLYVMPKFLGIPYDRWIDHFLGHGFDEVFRHQRAELRIIDGQLSTQ